MAVAYQAIELSDEQWEVFIAITANQVDDKWVTDRKLIECTRLTSMQICESLTFLEAAGLIISKQIEP